MASYLAGDAGMVRFRIKCRVVLCVFTVLLLAVHAQPNSFAQINSDFRVFFPMRVGDVWEYEYDDYPLYPRFQVKNVGDTLMPNGKVYSNLAGPSPGGFYRLDDSDRVFQYLPEHLRCPDSEFVVYNLSSADRSIWPSCLTPLGNFPANYVGIYGTSNRLYPRLGVTVNTKQFCEAQIDMMSGDTAFCPLVPHIRYSPRRLAAGFGLVWTQQEGPALNLDGAILNGIRYGTVTSADQQNRIPLTARREIVMQSYPNPFNSQTRIRYQVDCVDEVLIEVFDALGRKMRTVMKNRQERGQHEIIWDACGDNGVRVNSGVYFFRISIGDETATQKLALVR
jgi:hypothetical protein